INVTSYNNVVLVTGETPTEEMKKRAIDIVTNVPKVSHVYDELTIAAPSSLVSRSSDSLITSKVKTRLLTLDNFDGTRVKVVTEKGVVYLMGLLRRDESDRATEAARQVGGVQKVVKLFQYIE
ncbi:MAG TPA: BON domain-containing protein, partial [Gammaproteobacteria bacterium]|nr:BON domain-containing protein [Gammaproteobacteria bacterium]